MGSVGAALTPGEVAERAFTALVANNVNEFARYIDDGVVWELHPGADYFPEGRRWQGRDAVVNDFLLGTFAAYYDLSRSRLALISLVSGTEHALVEFSLTAVTSRGQHYYNEYLLVMHISGGRITFAREWTNTDYQRRMLVG